MYVKAEIIDDGNVIATIFEDIPNPEDYQEGTIVEEISGTGGKLLHTMKVTSRSETTDRDHTQTKPEKVKPMLLLKLEFIS